MHISGFLRRSQLSFIKKESEGGDIYSFSFSPSKPLKHIAGQHGVFILPGFKGVHIFTLSSAPSEEYVQITTHVRPESSYKQRLNNLKPGDKMTLFGPVLDFVFNDTSDTYVFLAQGIGITPFRSLLVEANAQNRLVTPHLIHVSNNSHTFRQLTEKLATTAAYPENLDAFTDELEHTIIQGAQYYISGSPKFVQATKQTLRNLGVERRAMKGDNFLGY